MKKLILIISLILLSACLLLSCNNENKDIDISDAIVNFRCELTIEETGETFFIYENEARYLQSLCIEEWETAEKATGIIYSDLNTIRMRFMSDIKEGSLENFTEMEKALMIFDNKLWFGEYFLYSDNKGYYSANPLMSYADNRQCNEDFYSTLLSYLNSINVDN